MAQEAELHRTAPFQIHWRLRWFAAWTCLIPLLHCGCGGRIPDSDSRSYPLQIRELRRFQDGAVWATEARGPAGEPAVLVAHLDPRRYERYLELTNLSGDAVYWRNNLAGTGSFNGGMLPNYQWIRMHHGLRPSAADRQFLGRYSHQHVALMSLDPSSGGVEVLVLVPRPADAPDSVDWDLSLSGPFGLAHLEGEPQPVLVSMNVNRWRSPRAVAVYDSLGAGEPRFRIESGGQLVYECGADLDGDGRLEWLFGSTAPCSGREAGGWRDSEAYYVALREDGSVLWSTTSGRGGGNTRLRWEERSGRLLGTRSCRHFTGEDLYTLVHELDPTNGNPLRESRWPGEVFFLDGCDDLLHVDVAAGQLQWIDSGDLTLQGRPVPIAGARGLASGPLEGPDGRRYLQLTTVDGGVLLLDEDLRVRGVSDQRLIPDERFRGMKPLVMLADRPGEQPRLVALEVVPAWRWWPWRWRWLLALGLGGPLLALSAWLVTRVVRLRREAARQLRRFAQLQLREREEERRRVARELHDELGQELVLARAAVLRERPTAIVPGEPGHEALAGLDAALASMRRVVSELRPTVLDDLGLRAAIEWQLERFAAQTGIVVVLEDDGESLALPPDLETALFRVFQEALTNVAKHACASRVDAALRRAGTQIELVVEDDGRGSDVATAAGRDSFGWIGMRERLAPWRGSVQFECSPLGGLGVRATVATEMLEGR